MVGLLAPRARLSNVASEANTIGGSKSTKYGNFRYHPDMVFEHVFPVVVSKSLSQPTVWGNSEHSWQASSSTDVSSNQFTGSLPSVSSTALDLSNSSFSGPIFHFFCERMSEPKELYSLILGKIFSAETFLIVG